MTSQCAVVTGAAGFVGNALVMRLLSEGFRVRALARRDISRLRTLGVETFQLDLVLNAGVLAQCFEGADVVFHCAAKVDMWGPFAEFFEANVIGTRNVIAACRRALVPNLVFTSSPSVVADGTDLSGINEKHPYPKKHQAAYPATKAQAEREILTANSEELRTLALRPHLIFGPGDAHFLPLIIERARQGRLPQIGNGSNKVDVCFIEDCVTAHLKAFRALEERRAEACGKSFFISQNEPVLLWDFVADVLRRAQVKPIRLKIPKAVALCLAQLFETISTVAPAKLKPLFTKFLVCEMTTDHYFDGKAAREALNYLPSFSVKEALDKTFSR